MLREKSIFGFLVVTKQLKKKQKQKNRKFKQNGCFPKMTILGIKLFLGLLFQEILIPKNKLFWD